MKTAKIKSSFFIMKMWQTGNIGSHNIAKVEGQNKDGYKTYKEAEDAIPKLLKEENWDVTNNPLTIIKIY